jgi:alkanesulfonate monooxygenase SsuD/methylene tetrahydromethanopterin reductase-like flavin-dependent oxidoreductase (luciferase family)
MSDSQSHITDAFSVPRAWTYETKKIALATSVATVLIRNPTTITRAAATVAVISEGRFRLGLSAVPYRLATCV